MVAGWVEADLEMLRVHLSAQDTGDVVVSEVAREGMLEAFVVAVEMWEAGSAQGGFESFVQAWEAAVPQGLRHVIAHVTAEMPALEGLAGGEEDGGEGGWTGAGVRMLVLGMRDLYVLHLPLVASPPGIGGVGGRVDEDVVITHVTHVDDPVESFDLCGDDDMEEDELRQRERLTERERARGMWQTGFAQGGKGQFFNVLSFARGNPCSRRDLNTGIKLSGQ